MNKIHDPVIIASYFLNRNQENGLTLMQILKLSYLAHGFKLGFTLGPMSDESAEAWKYGPVFPSLYHYDFDEYEPIVDNMIKKSEYTAEHIDLEFDSEEKSILNLVDRIYGNLEGWALSRLTHQKNTPWHTTYYEKGGKAKDGVPIDDKAIKQHFNSLIKEHGLHL